MTPAPFHADLAEAPPGGRAFWLRAADGKRIRAAVWEGGARGTVLLFSGRSEYIEKYGRVIARLTAMGFSIVTLDWRGQGLSDRPAAGTGVGHVDRFADYQQDIDALLASEPVAALGGPQVLICHSMGGCIGLRALVDGRVQPKAAIFSAPMWGVNLSPVIHSVAKTISRIGVALGLGERHALGGIGEKYYVLSETFEKNVLTNDPEYWNWMGAHLRAHPELGLGAPSLGWANGAFSETAALSRAAPPTTPTLALLGAAEEVVNPAAIHAQSARMPAATLSVIPVAKHEVFMEDFNGAIGGRVWGDIESFLAAQGI